MVARFFYHSITFSRCRIFEWRVDTGEYTTVTAVDGSSTVPLASLDYGVHRFEARAVLTTGALDPTPASFDWTIAHCNDGTEYQNNMSIESNGALTCIDCPHAVGSNCKTLDVTWEGFMPTKGGGRLEMLKIPIINAL